jgi:hypothetical protein
LYPYSPETLFSEGTGLASEVAIRPSQRSKSLQEQLVTFVDYRYSKFALNPSSGRFAMIRSADYNFLRAIYVLSMTEIGGTLNGKRSVQSVTA